MGSERFPLQTKTIFRNLPTFDPNLKGLTVIVTGANGISGFHTMRVLLESPERWTKVGSKSRVTLSKPEDLAKQLKDKGVTADYVFFYSYAQPRPKKGASPWSNAQELSDTNSALLRNFLGALDLVGITPKRFVLQTGAKNYGVHIGPIRTPMVESDPRVTIEPNFYYPQEDSLYAWCKAHSTSWNIVCPPWIIGAVNNAAMNALHPLAVYAAVQAHKGEKLEYPGDLNAWLGISWHSTAMLTGYLTEWLALEDKRKDQKFNACDACMLPTNRLWPELARWYGCEGCGKPELDESKLTTIDFGGKDTPLGYGGSSKMRVAWTLSKWAEDPANHKAWKEIMNKHKLTHDPFEDIEAHFPFGDMAAWGRSSPMSMNKAQLLGWTGRVDTLESLYMAYSELNKLEMLPPMIADARPLM